MATDKAAKIIPFPVDKRVDAVNIEEEETRSLSDFYVHAVLQAARASFLGLELDSAKSWGLYRAIFYEAEKSGAISHSPSSRQIRSGVLYTVGGEKACAIRTREGLRFVIGGKEQKPELFDRWVRRRFPNWNQAWLEAMTLVTEASLSVIRSASRFHKEIYKPWRSELSFKWSRGQPALDPNAVHSRRSAS